jgi:hypothetical protein
MRHIVMTTFNSKGYVVYGKKCIQTFLDHWPEDIFLWVYAEDVNVEETDPRLKIFDQNIALPTLREFRESYKNNPYANGRDPSGRDPEYNFRWDAVRFANKVFAVTDAIRRAGPMADQLIWLDADTITHKEIPRCLLDELAPKHRELAAYLNRRGCPECGWVGYNLRHERILEFADRFENIYRTGEFLRLKESHDSFVFWTIAKSMNWTARTRFKLLGSRFRKGHIFINSILGGYMDHLKGNRKLEGRSRSADLQWKRPEPWWKS